MHEAIDSRERHGLIREDLAPFAERLVGCDEHGAPFVACGDQLEQHAGLGLVLGDVGEIVEDEEISSLHAQLPASAAHGLPSSLVQLRSAVWTGVTRDTRPRADPRVETEADVPVAKKCYHAFVSEMSD